MRTIGHAVRMRMNITVSTVRRVKVQEKKGVGWSTVIDTKTSNFDLTASREVVYVRLSSVFSFIDRRIIVG